MERRRLLQLGLGAAALFGVAGVGVALLAPPYRDGRLSDTSRAFFAAVAFPLLEGSLPTGAAAHAALNAHIDRVEATIMGLPRHARDELGTLLQLMSTAPGRLLLTGATDDWTRMSSTRAASALQSMRRSSSTLRQQSYHALREISVGAYFSDPSTWSDLGYAGPVPL